MGEKRLGIMGKIFGIAGLVLVCALARISIFQSGEYSKSVAAQRRDSVAVKRVRGKFYDKNMIPLVDDSDVVVNVESNGKESEFVVNIPSRYGKNSLAEHLIGYTDSQGSGISGLEKSLDSVVNTDKFYRVNYITDVNGNAVKNAGISMTESSSDADSVVLTIDRRIQKAVEKNMDECISAGAVVVMDVKSFDILAMASRPNFDRNNVKKYIDGSGSEMVNRCTSPYNAGSIFKIITSCAAIEDAKAYGMYRCDGVMNIGGRNFACHKEGGHGMLDFENAFAQSCNCAYYQIGMNVGAQRIIETAQKFGLGNSVIENAYVSESCGNLPYAANSTLLDSVNYSIGQGEILITPVQAARMACIIANNGIAKSVNIADRIVDSDLNTKRYLRSFVQKTVISRDTAAVLQNCMKRAVESGTGSGAYSEKVSIAGKTGTAQTGWVENGENYVHGWFCGYFPADNPQYAMAVLAENGKSSSASAVPLFFFIAEDISEIY